MNPQNQNRRFEEGKRTRTVRDGRMQETINLVVSERDETGRWVLENTFNGRFQTNIEQKDKNSKWITLNALTLLKRYYS